MADAEQMFVKIKNSDNQPDPNIYLVVGIKPPLVEIKNTTTGKIVKVNQNRIIDVVDAPAEVANTDLSNSNQETNMAKKNSSNKITPVSTPAPEEVASAPVAPVASSPKIEEEVTVKPTAKTKSPKVAKQSKTPDTVEELDELNTKTDSASDPVEESDEPAPAKTEKAAKVKKVAIKAVKKPKVVKEIEKFDFKKYADEGYEIFTKSAPFTNKGVEVKGVVAEAHVLLSSDGSYYHTFNTYNSSLGKKADFALSKFEIKDADALTKKRAEWEKKGYVAHETSEVVEG